MTDVEALLVTTLVALGAYSTYLLSVITKLKEAIDTGNEMILAMARELKELGSPNVFIEEVDEDQ